MPARMIVSTTLLALILSAAIALPSWAEEAVAQKLVDARKPRVDEAALRYYASLKQTARVEAETLRLKRLHTGWSPPSDLWSAKPGNPDDAPLWDLFAADKIDELRAVIAARRAREPQWVLSTDLEQKLARKNARAAILSHAKARRWNDVAALANAWLSADDATDVEVLWAIAEGFARTRRMTDAQQIFETILRSSEKPDERVATIQKAVGLLPMSVAEKLIDSGRRDAAGRSEFDGLAIDITRARISAWLHDAPGKDVTPPELTAFQDYAASAADPNQSALLAWYALKRADLPEALEQFKTAIAKGGDATVAHGLAHTLRQTGRLREAEEVAYAWRGPSAANAILFIDVLADQLTQGTIAIDAKRLTRYAEVTLQTSSGEGAQALGWYAYNSCQLDAASEWFKRAVAWMPKETSAFGYALTLRRLKKTQDYIDIVNRYDGLFPKVVALMYPSEDQAGDPCNRRPTDGAQSPSDASSRSVQQATAPAKLVARSQVPMPSILGRPAIQEFAGPKRTEFPIATSLENPYRSLPPDRASTPKTGFSAWRPTAASTASLEARRVFGVGPMPYERYGKPVLPGLNGITQPSPSQELALQAPRGTLWSDQRASLDASSMRAGAASSNASPGAVASVGFSSNRFHP